LGGFHGTQVAPAEHVERLEQIGGIIKRLGSSDRDNRLSSPKLAGFWGRPPNPRMQPTGRVVRLTSA
jgi:hypothetical protein